MDFRDKLESDYLAMSELTTEIGSIIQKSLDDGHDDLNQSDIEHILKITSDVTRRIIPPIKNEDVSLEINQLLVMTRTVSGKLKKNLLVN